MNKKILIKKNALSMEMALLLDDELIRYYVESTLEVNWQNRIVMGQVQQVVKNLNAAFIDYGEDKNGMLHLKQVPECYLNKLQQGYTLPVQITKQNVGEKGHKLTAKLNFSGQYVVCLPFESGIHISKKIKDDLLRQKIRMALEEALGTSFGWIVRTHAQEIPIETLISDAQNTSKQVELLLKSSAYLMKGNVLYEEPMPIYQMIIDTLIKKQELEIICNDQQVQENIQTLIESYGDIKKVKCEGYKTPHTLFADYGLNKKIEQLTKRKIWLKNGGNLIIDYTEAMTIIDVNSAKAVLTKNPDKAVFELNKEAVKASILQMLRRNLSGMIIMDLVEMKSKTYKEEIYLYAKALLDSYGDTRTKVYPLTELSLLQFTRTKEYECVAHKLLTVCTLCQMPYVQEDYLMSLMKLEEQLKGVTLQESKQSVYLQVKSPYYERMIEEQIVPILESNYPVVIEMKKSKSECEKNILCQFYKR